MRTTSTNIAFALLLFTACEEDDGNDDGAVAEETGDPGESEGSGSSSGGEMNFDELYACEDPEPLVVQPLAGPGWDPETGLVDPDQESYVASSTMIMVKPDQQGLFFELVGAVNEQIMATDGFVAMSLATDAECGWARTMTIWRDETAMYSFVVNGAHADAMNRTGEVAITGKVTSWPIMASEMPPTWTTAKAKLAEIEPLEVY
jgi:heme-degrading monooxygenase HmoA